MDPALAVEHAALSRQKTMNDALDIGDSPVQRFYEGKTIFITGGSGFLGKQLIEKLFRACNIHKMFVLLRPKKGKEIGERLQEMFKDPVFDMVKERKPLFAERIVPIEGDVSELKLGLSEKNWNIITKETEVIFHMAATTRFDEPVNVATMINIRGTREAILLGKECQKIKSFVYVSTTYTNATDSNLHTEVLEKFYPSPVDPDLMILMAETMEPERLNAIEAQLIKGYKNTYTFAKAVAEDIVKTLSGDLPICIVRPAVVISSYREPMPGWTDMSCTYGASGMILGPATGLIHATYTNNSAAYSLVPVDYVNNAVLVAGYHTGTKTDKDIKIYAVSSARQMFVWRPVYTKLRELGRVLPSPLAVWYVYTVNTGNKHLFLLLTWLLHFIPGLIMDAACLLIRKPPMFTKIYRKVYKSSLALSYFTTHTWVFDDANADKLYLSLTPNDKLIFNFDTTNIDQMEYVTLWCVGIRKYLIKDGIKNTNYAIRKQFWLHKLHCLATIIYVYFIFKFLSIVSYFILSIFS
ncbi:fatty acyl-CoA reductase wat-like [Trichoplusia ni]|uniref:Fatty acyl-CoA reductase n=1 Tax=Trichoplusia ni TaxID=7111 RepID=A0A7E5WHL0_TRINI|nr:fatty acyl-CoA reductase wat-like [Trichoplusia ni]